MEINDRAGRHRLRGRQGRHGVADGRRRHQQRRDHVRPLDGREPRRGRFDKDDALSRNDPSTPFPCWWRTNPASSPACPGCSRPAGFNIDSLAVGRDGAPGRLPHDDRGQRGRLLPLEQVTKQLNKLVHVLKIVELEPATQSVQRELLLVKVRADARVRSQVLETVSCSGPAWSTSPRTRLRSRRRARLRRSGRAAPRPGAVRHQGDGAVRASWPSAAVRVPSPPVPAQRR